MRIYLDLCRFNCLYDDQSQTRIRLGWLGSNADRRETRAPSLRATSLAMQAGGSLRSTPATQAPVTPAPPIALCASHNPEAASLQRLPPGTPRRERKAEPTGSAPATCRHSRLRLVHCALNARLRPASFTSMLSTSPRVMAIAFGFGSGTFTCRLQAARVSVSDSASSRIFWSGLTRARCATSASFSPAKRCQRNWTLAASATVFRLNCSEKTGGSLRSTPATPSVNYRMLEYRLGLQPLLPHLLGQGSVELGNYESLQARIHFAQPWILQC